MASMLHSGNQAGSGRTLKLAFLIGIHLCFGLLATLAIYFAQERLFMDASYYLFQVVNKEAFHVELQRFVLVFGQWLPWVGVKLNMPMVAVIVLASLGYVLFYYVLFLLCWLRYKRPEAGVAMILIQLLGVVHGFFTPVFELYLAAGLLIVYDTIFRIEAESWKKHAVLAVLQVVILLSHPMALVLWGLVVWSNLYNRTPFPWRPLVAMIGLALLVYLINAPFTEVYEQEKFAFLLGRMKDPESYRPLLDLGYCIELIRYLLVWYWEALSLFVISVVVLWRKGGYKLPLVCFAAFLLILVVNQVGYNGLQSGRYMEQVYFPMVAVAILLCLWTWRALTLRGRWAILAIILILVASRAIRVVDAGQHFQYRNAQLHRLIDHVQKQESDKWLTTTENLARSYNWGNWSIPVEVLLLSAMDGPGKAVNIAFRDSWQNMEMKPGENAIIFRLNEVYETGQLNDRYFDLRPGPYQWLQNPHTVPPSPEQLRNTLQLRAKPDVKYRANTRIHIPLEIKYGAPQVLPVHAGNRLFLSYHWYIEPGKPYVWDGIRTPIEVDVSGTYRQTLEVVAPDKAGNYLLEIDWVLEDIGWGGKADRHHVLIH